MNAQSQLWRLWLLYLQRLIGSQIIRPITQSNWYQPRVVISGSTVPAVHDRPATTSGLIAPNVLDSIDDYLQQQNSHALLIMHQDQLVHAKYWNFKPHYTFNSMSMVKTVQALSIGIAIDLGLIGSVHDSVAQYLPEWQNDERAKITIEHLLTMQSGLKSDLSRQGVTVFPAIVPLYLGTNIKKHALALPAVSAPGSYFEYNNYNTQILGLILEQVSGLSSAEFFSKHIWQPLECHDASLWLDQENGTARTFGALFARPEDWLRIASLFLTQGRYKDRQIVSEAWLKEMIIPRNTEARGVKDGKSDYGYQIWLKAHDYGLIRGIPWFEATHAQAAHVDQEMFYFEGMRGQYLFVSPRHNLLMLRMGERPKRDWDGSWAINQLLQHLDEVPQMA